jgi:hypothetical protein
MRFEGGIGVADAAFSRLVHPSCNARGHVSCEKPAASLDFRPDA